MSCRLRFRLFEESHELVVDVGDVHPILGGSNPKAVGDQLDVLLRLVVLGAVQLELGVLQMLLADLMRFHFSDPECLVRQPRGHP